MVEDLYLEEDRPVTKIVILNVEYFVAVNLTVKEDNVLLVCMVSVFVSHKLS